MRHKRAEAIRVKDRSGRRWLNVALNANAISGHSQLWMPGSKETLQGNKRASQIGMAGPAPKTNLDQGEIDRSGNCVGMGSSQNRT